MAGSKEEERKRKHQDESVAHEDAKLIGKKAKVRLNRVYVNGARIDGIALVVDWVPEAEQHEPGFPDAHGP